MTTEDTKQESTDIEPTGGWLQYKLSVVVLTLYPMLILVGAFALLYAWPHVHRAPAQTEIVSPESHEPFHLSLQAPSAQETGRAELAYGPAYQRQ